MSEQLKDDLQLIFQAMLLVCLSRGGSHKMATVLKIKSALDDMQYAFDITEIRDGLDALIKLKLVRYYTYADKSIAYSATKLGLRRWYTSQTTPIQEAAPTQEAL